MNSKNESAGLENTHFGESLWKGQVKHWLLQFNRVRFSKVYIVFNFRVCVFTAVLGRTRTANLSRVLIARPQTWNDLISHNPFWHTKVDSNTWQNIHHFPSQFHGTSKDWVIKGRANFHQAMSTNPSRPENVKKETWTLGSWVLRRTHTGKATRLYLS